MTIKKAILSAKEPKETNTAWVQPKGDSLQLNIFNNGKWRPIAGDGNNSNSSTTISQNITSETTYEDLKTLFDAAAIEKGLNKTDLELSNMSNREYRAYMKEYAHALKDTTFISDRHGKSVNVLFDDNRNPPAINILYEDGYVVSYRNDYDTKEIPPTMRYCYARENQNTWLWDVFGEKNIYIGNAHTLTTTLYVPDTGMVFNLSYINPSPESQTYPMYSRWTCTYPYNNGDNSEDKVDYITLVRRPQLG